MDIGGHLRAPTCPAAAPRGGFRAVRDSLGAMRAIQMTEFGGPEVLRLKELPRPEPRPGEALIRVTRAGLNFADTHTRTNSYVQKATLPLVPGGEVAGTLEERGEIGRRSVPASGGQRVVALVG